MAHKSDSKIKAFETCSAISALCMMLYLFWGLHAAFLYVALLLNLISLITTRPFIPLSRGWFRLGEVLGGVVSRVLLIVVYFGLLTPVAILYRMTRKNPLLLKRTSGSAFVVRDHEFARKDMQDPY